MLSTIIRDHPESMQMYTNDRMDLQDLFQEIVDVSRALNTVITRLQKNKRRPQRRHKATRRIISSCNFVNLCGLCDIWIS